MSIDTDNGNYKTIRVRRQHEYPTEEWARLTVKWDRAQEEHGAGNTFVNWPGDFGDDRAEVLELAYALTVHKSQGSHFNQVFLSPPNHASS